MLYRVEGIVIRSMDYGESNKIVTLLTKSQGKVGVLIRGAKKVRSRHSSLAQLFTYGEFSYFRTKGLGTLNHGEIIQSHHDLREDLDLSAHAAYAVELTDRTLQEDEPGNYYFEQLNAYLEALSDKKDTAIVTQLYEMRVLDFAGYAPQLEYCVQCGQEAAVYKLSVQFGGALCPRCQHNDRFAVTLSEGAQKLLKLYRRMDLRRLGNIQVREETKQELKKAMRALLDAQLGLQLKSRAFLEQLDKLN